MRKLRLALLSSCIAGSVLALRPALAQTPQVSAQIEALQSQLLALQRQLDELRQQLDQQKQTTATQARELGEVRQRQAQVQTQAQASASAPAAAPAPAPDAGHVSFPNGRPTLTSNDGRFSIGLTGKIHFDTAHYIEGRNRGSVPAATEDLNSGTNMRRAQLGVTGRVFRDFEYLLNYEFGGAPDNNGTLEEARISYVGIPNLSLEIGQLEPALTLEEGTSSNDNSFLEQAAAVNMSSSLAAASGRQAVGGRWWGDRHFLGAYLTGGSAGTEADDEQRGATLRIAGLPYRDGANLIHLGASGSYVFKPNETNGGADTVRFRDRPELRVDSNRLVDTGPIDASHAYTGGVELAAVYRNLSLQGEYLRFGADRKPGQPDVDFGGWYVFGSWVLTGESRRYNNARGAFGGVRPERPFDPAEGGWGAFELLARYSTVDLNDRDVRGGEQDVITLGLNWYLNNNIRFMFNYQYVDVDRRDATGLQIGQDFHAISMRAQANW